MKIGSLALCCTSGTAALLLLVGAGSADAFAPQPSLAARPSSAGMTGGIALQMFGGAGEGVPGDDDPEELAKMEQAAKAMGMSVEEYKLGITARVRLSKALDEARVTGGDASRGVQVERDGNNPPKFLDIKITDAGKALGKEKLSSELVAALKTASDESRKARAGAQKDMMAFISEEMKGIKK